MKLFFSLIIFSFSQVFASGVESVEIPKLIIPNSLEVPLLHKVVIGGNNVSADGQFQRQTVFLRPGHNGGSDDCTGVIVAQDLVLTAAHCIVTSPGLRAPTVYFGVRPIDADGKIISGVESRDVVDLRLLELDIDSKSEGASTDIEENELNSALGSNDGAIASFLRFIGLKKRFFNLADYIRPEFMNHDLALLKLANPIPLGHQPAQFFYGKISFNQQVYAAGYGFNPESEQYYGILTSASQRVFGYYRLDNELPMYWGAQNTGVQGQVCFADSGGPLYIIKNKQLMLLGITAFTTTLCDTGHTWFVNPHYFKNELIKAAEQLGSTTFL